MASRSNVQLKGAKNNNLDYSSRNDWDYSYSTNLDSRMFGICRVALNNVCLIVIQPQIEGECKLSLVLQLCLAKLALLLTKRESVIKGAGINWHWKSDCMQIGRIQYFFEERAISFSSLYIQHCKGTIFFIGGVWTKIVWLLKRPICRTKYVFCENLRINLRNRLCQEIGYRI